jgi:selenide,water dikinase
MTIEYAKKLVKTENGKILNYQVLALNLGTSSQPLPGTIQSDGLLYVRPVINFLERLESEQIRLKSTGKILIGGGGASGFELAIACSYFFQGSSITLASGKSGLLPTQNPKAQKLASEALNERRIRLERKDVTSIQDSVVFLDQQAFEKFDLCIMAVSVPPEAHQVSVDHCLQIINTDGAFAAGDCARFFDRALPRAGVFAVRQGKILARNITASLTSSPLSSFRPPKEYLSLMVCGYKDVILCWGSISFRSKLLWYLKDFIDRRFMRQFR